MHPKHRRREPGDSPSDDEGTPLDEDASEVEHTGVEIFADLADASDADHDGADDDTADRDDSDRDDSDGSDADEDPRSAAVSSMLAAAARAYYEDEPKDYPLSPESADDASTESAHWSIASTGVIDTVPLAASDEATDDESAPEETPAEEVASADGESDADADADGQSGSERAS